MNAEAPARSVADKDMYPVLTTAQIQRMAPLGRERPFELGEILFEQGRTNRPLIVVLEGEIDQFAKEGGIDLWRETSEL